jgi:hypothetical protein
MDFGKAFSYAFEDQDWIKKVGIAALIMLIPILGQIIIGGWALEITRRVIRRDPEPLPDWSEFGDYLVKGLQVFVIGFAYSLPIILISICTQVPTAFLADQGGDAENLIIVLSICTSCISMIYGIFLGFVLPAALGNFAAHEQLGAGFRFGEVFGLVRAAPMAYLLVLVGSFVAGLVAMLGLIACFIGVFFTVPFSYAINAHLQGQAYNEAIAARGSQAEFA